MRSRCQAVRSYSPSPLTCRTAAEKLALSRCADERQGSLRAALDIPIWFLSHGLFSASCIVRLFRISREEKEKNGQTSKVNGPSGCIVSAKLQRQARRSDTKSQKKKRRRKETLASGKLVIMPRTAAAPRSRAR